MPAFPAPIMRVAGRPVLVVVAHADDATLFVGGTMRMLADSGSPVYVIRFTDDATDSVRLSNVETIERNSTEFERACDLLGVSTWTSLGFPSDALCDVPRSVLREAVIRAVRTHRPYAVLTFDPYAVHGEDNQDHIRVAQETDEAFWTSMFDKHHPEHREVGLEPHGVVERWYFGRHLTETTARINITTVREVKTAAALAHRTMLGNLVHQLRLMGRTAGVDSAALEIRLADERSLVSSWFGKQPHEDFRIVRYAGMSDVLTDLEGAIA